MNWVLLKNSMLLASGTAAVAMAIGFAAALFASTIGTAARRWVIALAVTNLALPSFLVANCWLDLLGQGGLWRAWAPINIYSLGGTIWILALLLWPIAFLLVLASFARLQPSQIESEPMLKGTSLIRWLVFPAARSALAQSAVLIFVLAFNNFAVPTILQTKVYPAELWVSFNTTFDYANALKLSWPLCLGPILLLLALGGTEIAWPRAEWRVPPRLLAGRFGPIARIVLGAVTCIVLFLGLGVPAGQLAFSLRTWQELADAFAAGHRAIWNSIGFAAASATICGAIGLLCWPRREAAVLWLGFLIPGIMLGIALIFAFNRGPTVWLYQSAAIVVVALALRYAALSWMAARRAMQALPLTQLEFARLHGATRWQLFRHVRGPAVSPELGAVWFITYLLCLWDVETLVLIIPPGCETLALRVFNLLHYGHAGQVNALCMILLGAAVLPLALRAAANRVVTLGWGRSGLWMAALGVAISAGCSRDPEGGAAIHSSFFSSVQIIGSRGTALGQFNKPRSVTVDDQDNLYVVDMTGRVQKFSSNGVYLLSWQMPETDKGKPKGMCRDREGNIVVVEPHYQRVNHFTPSGKLVAQWGQSGANQGQLCLPRAVAVNSHGDIWVCEYTLVDRVQEFSAEGKRWKLAVGKSGLGNGEFNRPEGLAIDRDDRVYVADSCNHRIQILSPGGQFLRAYGAAGSGPGQMSYPYDVQVDSAGRQYVCEFGNSRVQIFDAAGKSLELLGGPGAAPGQFSNPWSIALDSAGNLYVADSQNHRVQKFIRKPVTDERHTSRQQGGALASVLTSSTQR